MRHAEALNAEKLAFLTDIEGVYKDPKDPESLISELHVQEARDLITNGNVGGGMIPKLQAVSTRLRTVFQESHHGRKNPALPAA